MSGKAHTHMLSTFGVQLESVPVGKVKYHTIGRVMELWRQLRNIITEDGYSTAEAVEAVRIPYIIS
jgi:hypothetical protein